MSLDTGLEYSGSLPYSVRPVRTLPEAGELLAINQGNELALRSVMMLEDKPDLDDDDEVVQELKRQDMKLNLLLDMLSTLLVRSQAIPESKELILTDSSLSFPETESSLSGSCEVQLYIAPSVPRPLRLFGIAAHDQESGRTVVRFQGMSQALVDGLDKYIFRFHRRQVASAKAG